MYSKFVKKFNDYHLYIIVLQSLSTVIFSGSKQDLDV